MIHRKRHFLTVPIGAVAALVLAVAPATAVRPDQEIVLPGAASAEGIASGAGSTFYAGELFTGDVFRGDIQNGTAERFIDAPDGRLAVGMKADVGNGLLFVAGGATGQAYLYDLATGEPVAEYTLGEAPTTFINDVALTIDGAWFTDSVQAKLYFIPVNSGTPGPSRTLNLSGPAADVSGEFNNNGIQATTHGKTLLVAHSGQGAINVVDPATGSSHPLAGVEVPSVDGILVEGHTLWAVQNFENKITEFRLDGLFTSGSLRRTIESPKFQVPTTVARFGGRLAAANAKFDTGLPPTADEYEVIVVDRLQPRD